MRPHSEIGWDERVRRFLAGKCLSNPTQRECFERLWGDYLSAGLPRQHFVSEITNGCDSTFHQRCWEMLLARHLVACGHSVTTNASGPDFRFERNYVAAAHS